MDHFPTRLALGETFCNRIEEIKRLTADINNVNPALIMSPRRYGKTSLALKVLEQLKLPYVHIDFYKELSEKDIEKAILNGIGKLIGSLEKTPKRLIKLAGELFSSIQVKIGLEENGLTLDFSRREEIENTADILLRTLEKLHELAKKRNTIVVLFMDEFQVLGEVLKTHAVEAAIRQAAQKSTHVAYIFSGSNRHLLSEMFYDKKRPFYKLCDCILLDRIPAEAYEKYIQGAALAQWGKALAPNTIHTIFELTERHSYYINKLCSLLWLNNFPDHLMVKDIWNDYTLENKTLIAKEIETLSLNQRRLLVELAKRKPIKEIYAKTFVRNLELSSGSIYQVLNKLKDKDYIYIDHEGYYRILDPLMRSVLAS